MLWCMLIHSSPTGPFLEQSYQGNRPDISKGPGLLVQQKHDWSAALWSNLGSAICSTTSPANPIEHIVKCRILQQKSNVNSIVRKSVLVSIATILAGCNLLYYSPEVQSNGWELFEWQIGAATDDLRFCPLLDQSVVEDSTQWHNGHSRSPPTELHNGSSDSYGWRHRYYAYILNSLSASPRAIHPQ